MKLVFIFFIFLLITNCSLNSDSKYWTNDTIDKNNDLNNVNNYSKDSAYLMKMTFDEFKIYMDEYAKKSKYPNISE